MAISEIDYGFLWENISSDHENITVVLGNGNEVGIPNDGRLHSITLSENILMQLTSNIVWTIKYLMRLGLINTNPPHCIAHNCEMKLSSYKKCSDKFQWRCRHKTGRKSCTKSKTIRNKSIFENSRITLRQGLMLIYFWSERRKQSDVKRELAIRSNHSITDWYKTIRLVCSVHLIKHPFQLDGNVIEIDESNFRKKAKNHVGNAYSIPNK